MGKEKSVKDVQAARSKLKAIRFGLYYGMHSKRAIELALGVKK